MSPQGICLSSRPSLTHESYSCSRDTTEILRLSISTVLMSFAMGHTHDVRLLLFPRLTTPDLRCDEPCVWLSDGRLILGEHVNVAGVR